MAGFKRITDFTNTTTLTDEDVLYFVRPSGITSDQKDRKITWANLKTNINGSITGTTGDMAVFKAGGGLEDGPVAADVVVRSEITGTPGKLTKYADPTGIEEGPDANTPTFNGMSWEALDLYFGNVQTIFEFGGSYPSNGYGAVAGADNSGEMVIAFEIGAPHYSDDDGESWTIATTYPIASGGLGSSFYQMLGYFEGAFWMCFRTISAGEKAGALYKSTDGGDTWTLVYTFTTGFTTSPRFGSKLFYLSDYSLYVLHTGGAGETGVTVYSSDLITFNESATTLTTGHHIRSVNKINGTWYGFAERNTSDGSGLFIYTTTDGSTWTLYHTLASATYIFASNQFVVVDEDRERVYIVYEQLTVLTRIDVADFSDLTTWTNVSSGTTIYSRNLFKIGNHIIGNEQGVNYNHITLARDPGFGYLNGMDVEQRIGSIQTYGYKWARDTQGRLLFQCQLSGGDSCLMRLGL